MTSPAGPPAIALAGIDKRFGPVHANRAVDMTVARGSVHGIVGENGAGKSTLMNILYGYHQADAGEIRIHGRRVEIRDSQQAIALGIGMVHQHFMLIDSFTVLENLVLGAEGGALLGRALVQARARLEALGSEYGLAVDLDARVGDLPVGLRQRVEILKALGRGADILILDEPTAVLTPREADHLFTVLDRLRREGRTILLITHKLREIMAISDRVSVMRGGAVVAEREAAETDVAELAELMVGRKVQLAVGQRTTAPGDELLKVEGLTIRDETGAACVGGVDFSLRRGEILGIAGVTGNGQSELLEALAGMRPLAAGTIRIAGRALATDCDPRTLRRLGVCHVPEDRQRTGLIAAFSLSESAILGYQDDAAINCGPLLDRGAIDRRCSGYIEAYEVRPPDCRVRTALLSGGNQQKLVLARELDQDPELLLIGQPTRGVDVGAIELIHRRLLALRDAGKAILLVSAELDEILSLSDRILVMSGGRVIGMLDREAATDRKLGLLMAGLAAEPAA